MDEVQANEIETYETDTHETSSQTRPSKSYPRLQGFIFLNIKKILIFKIFALTLDVEQSNEPVIEKTKKCIIILEDIRENSLFDKYLKKAGDAEKQSDESEPGIEAVQEDLSPIAILESDDEESNHDQDDFSSSELAVIEISSDSD